MPTPCYISIEGKTQGNITAGAFTAESVGNIYVQGHEDEMLVQSLTIPSPSRLTRNPASHPASVRTVRLNSPSR